MISPTLTALAQRELGPGYLVRVTDYGSATYTERVELLGPRLAIVNTEVEVEVLGCLGYVPLTYEQLAASELSICAQRRHALQALVADRLAAA